MRPEANLRIRGFEIYRGFLSPTLQSQLVADLRALATQVPLFHPVTPGGRQMSVRMTSAGQVGWVTDHRGYRYQDHHPNGASWPAIPERVLEVWNAVSGVTQAPDSCLVNFYGQGAKMGMHQDKDESSFEWPVVSLSLGDEALFRMADTKGSSPSDSIWLASGDVVVMAGAARLAYHGVDKIRFGSSRLLPQAGRINITLRVAR